MDTNWTAALAIVASFIQLAAGLGLGLWLGRNRAGRHAPKGIDPAAIEQLVASLEEVASNVAADVGAHSSQVGEKAEQLRCLADANSESLGSVVLAVVGQIIDSNARLQKQLAVAEIKLEQQSESIRSHLAEARTDVLTGLLNRRGFENELTRRIAESKRTRHPLTLMLIDIDHFKKVNDRFGHLSGDIMLRAVARSISATMREMDLVARFGGEEFAVICPATPVHDALLAGERVRRVVAETSVELDDQSVSVTVSLGLAQAFTADDLADFVQRADEALYAAKDSGRDATWYHDGRECRPAPRADQVSCSPTSAPDDHLEVVCDDLRRRLKDVTGA